MVNRNNWDDAFLQLIRDAEKAELDQHITWSAIYGRLSIVLQAEKAFHAGESFATFLHRFMTIVGTEIGKGMVHEDTFKIFTDFVDADDKRKGV